MLERRIDQFAGYDQRHYDCQSYPAQGIYTEVQTHDCS